MHYQFEINNGKVYVYSENFNKTERDMNPNIEEILVKENNISYFKKSINDLNEKIKLEKKTKKLGYFISGFGILLFGISTTFFITGNIFGGIIEFLIGAWDIYSGFFKNIRTANKNIRIIKKQISLLEQSIKEEEENLDILKDYNPNKKKSIIISNHAIELVPMDKKIIEQERKGIVAIWYKNHRKQLIKAFKENKLDDIIACNVLPALPEDVDFISEIIKADLNIDDYKTKKQKT